MAHALIRANQRGITGDLIELTILTGKMIRFGKNRVKFVKILKEKEIICIDEIRQNTIKIVTITARKTR